MIDYKKAWNTLKRNLVKGGDPYEVNGCMYMTARQIQNHTATILLTNLTPYETRIKTLEETIDMIMSYDSWTDEEKSKSKTRYEEQIVNCKEKLNKYGTVRNEAEITVKNITSTDAWKVFAETVNVKSLHYEEKENCLYLRINY